MNQTTVHVHSKTNTSPGVWEAQITALIEQYATVCQGESLNQNAAYTTHAIREAEIIAIATRGDIMEAFAIFSIGAMDAMFATLVCLHDTRAGTAVMMKLEEYAKQSGTRAMYLKCSLHMATFYRGLGYEFRSVCDVPEKPAITQAYEEFALPYLQKHTFDYLLHMNTEEAAGFREFTRLIHVLDPEACASGDRVNCTVQMTKCFDNSWNPVPKPRGMCGIL